MQKRCEMKVLMTRELYELYTEGKSREYKDVAMNKELYAGFVRAVRSMEFAEKVAALRQLSYLHYEKLRYQLSELSSVRLSNRFVHRLIFRELEDGIQVDLIEIDNTHYGNKK